MGSSSGVAVRAPRAAVLAALCRAASARESASPEPVADDEAVEVHQRRHTELPDAMVLLVYSVGEWTFLEDLDLIMPNGDATLRAISAALGTTVLAFTWQGTSNVSTFFRCEFGTLTRAYESGDGEVERDEGDDPPLDDGDVEAAFEALVPAGAGRDFTIHVLEDASP